MSRLLLLLLLGTTVDFIEGATDSAVKVATDSLSFALKNAIASILKVALHPLETVSCAGDQVFQLLGSLASLSGTLIGSYLRLIFGGLDALPEIVKTLGKSLNNFQGNSVSKVTCLSVSNADALTFAQGQIGKLTSVVNEIANLIG